MPNLACVYSTIPELTLTDLRDGNFDPNVDTTKIEQYISQNDISFVIKNTDKYHYKLETIASSPYIVYGIGNRDLLNSKIIGMVGPRNPTQYATKVMQEIFQNMKHYNLVTISGLADGIDSLCHRHSILNDIPTIAVLGGGIGRFLNSKNRDKIQKIVDHGGLVISEFKILQEPANYTFPQRNRIIAGLGDVLFVPEAGIKSGSLITVDFALQMHKKVYATPNSIFEPNSHGILEYMTDGKITVIADFDVFLSTFFTKKTSDQDSNFSQISDTASKLSGLPKYIFEIIASKTDGISIESILSELKVRGQSITVSDLSTELTMLELDSIICQEKPGLYKKL